MIQFDNEYFSVSDTLQCGQVFRYREYKDSYIIVSADKLAYVYEKQNKVFIDGDDYFYDYFDLDRDYSAISAQVLSYNEPFVSAACRAYKGIRILRQNRVEALISFIISQNNNIPRIKSIIERLCENAGERKSYNGMEYYAFPTVECLAEKDEDFFAEMGLGYRAKYVYGVVKSLADGSLNLDGLTDLPTCELRKALLKINGIGEKVADCVIFFGFGRTDSFPVDTWIEKFYSEDLKGELKDRKKISEELVSRYKEYSGYVQQYVFHAKRNAKKLLTDD